MRRVVLKIILGLMILFPFAAKANMIWPSIFIVQQYYTWYVIAIGLVIEFFAVKIFLKSTWRKSAVIAISMNAISAFVGLLLIPASGIIVEFITIPLGGGTFQLTHWILDYIVAVLCNVLIEGLTLKWIFKYSFKQNFWWLLGAKAISVLIYVFNPITTN